MKFSTVATNKNHLETFKKPTLLGLMPSNSECWDLGGGVPKKGIPLWSLSGQPLCHSLLSPSLSLKYTLKTLSSFCFLIFFMSSDSCRHYLSLCLNNPWNTKRYTLRGGFPGWIHLAAFPMPLELNKAAARSEIHCVHSKLGSYIENSLTQQNEQHTSQLSPPVLGHTGLMAHSNAGENRQQQENGGQPQNRGCNHQGSAGLDIAWTQETDRSISQGSPWSLHHGSREFNTIFLPLAAFQDLACKCCRRSLHIFGIFF